MCGSNANQLNKQIWADKIYIYIYTLNWNLTSWHKQSFFLFIVIIIIVEIKNELNKNLAPSKLIITKWDKLYDLNVCFISIITNDYRYKHLKMCTECTQNTHITYTHSFWIHRLPKPYWEKHKLNGNNNNNNNYGSSKNENFFRVYFERKIEVRKKQKKRCIDTKSRHTNDDIER